MGELQGTIDAVSWLLFGGYGFFDQGDGGVCVFRGRRRSLLLENLALRQQLVALKRRHPRPSLCLFDKLFWWLLGGSGRIGSSRSSWSRRKPWSAVLAAIPHGMGRLREELP